MKRKLKDWMKTDGLKLSLYWAAETEQWNSCSTISFPGEMIELAATMFAAWRLSVRTSSQATFL